MVELTEIAITSRKIWILLDTLETAKVLITAAIYIIPQTLRELVDLLEIMPAGIISEDQEEVFGTTIT